MYCSPFWWTWFSDMWNLLIRCSLISSLFLFPNVASSGWCVWLYLIGFSMSWRKRTKIASSREKSNFFILLSIGYNSWAKLRISCIWSKYPHFRIWWLCFAPDASGQFSKNSDGSCCSFCLFGYVISFRGSVRYFACFFLALWCGVIKGIIWWWWLIILVVLEKKTMCAKDVMMIYFL